MSFTNNIIKYFEQNAAYADSAVKFNSIIISLKKELQVIPYYFRHFSRHDASHSEKIIQHLEMLLGASAINMISISDQVMIIMSAYAHDVGMSLDYRQVEDFFRKSDYEKNLKEKIPSGYRDLDSIVKELLEFPESLMEYKNYDVLKIYSDVSIAIENIFRSGHAHRSEKYITSNRQIIDFLGIRGAKLLGRICAAHDGPIANIMDFPKEENGFFGDYMHPRFIIGLLCLGDLLDLDTDRFDETALRTASEMPMLSMLHKKKHESIEHYLVRDGRIEIQADCNDYDTCQTLQEWTGWIKDVCSYLLLNWDEITPDEAILAPRLKKCEIVIKGNKRWAKYSDSKIHIDTDKAVKIFEGSNIYRGKQTFIRELIQNAVDASLIQLCEDAKYLDENADETLTAEAILKLIDRKKLLIENYDIFGRFYTEAKENASGQKYDENIRTDNPPDELTVKFELEDHGTGISEEELKSIIGLKGKSKTLKDKIASIPVFFRPAGIFGIGLQSVFQVAGKVEFITKTENENAKVITINDPSVNGSVYIEDFEGTMHRGTKVIVTFNPDKFTQTDIGCADYIYQTTPKYQMLLTWIFRHAYNIEKEDVPGFEAERQTNDYFNISITGRFGDEEQDRDVLKRKSLLPDLSKGYQNEQPIKLNSGTLSYRYYDLENNCIFDANFLTGFEEKYFTANHSVDTGLLNKENGVEAGAGKDIQNLPDVEQKAGKKLKKEDRAEQDRDENVSGYGRCSNWHSYKYGHNVFYRNVLAKHDLMDSWNDENKVGKFLDFKINLFSDDADKILNIGRNQITQKYQGKLMNLVDYEIAAMFMKIIDYCIQDEVCREKLIFIIYIQSLVLGYRSEEIYAKYKTFIDKMEVNNYYDVDGQEVSFPLKEIKSTRVYFINRIDEKESDFPESIWESKNNCREITEENGLICNYAVHSTKLNDEHVLTHYLTGEYYTVIDEKKYLVYETVPYYKGMNVTGPFRADYIRYKELLHVILNSLRCVIADGDYKVLETPMVEGVYDSYHHKKEEAVEVMLDPKIKNKLAALLLQFGYISDAHEAIKEIEKTEIYRKNIAYIVGYQKKLGDGINDEVVEKKYRQFIIDLLKLLEKEEYGNYLKTHAMKIQDHGFGSNRLNFGFSYFSHYVIKRFIHDQ